MYLRMVIATMQKGKTMDDLINRQQAIDAVHKYFNELLNKQPYETDADGDEVYTDMNSVNAILQLNKEISKVVKRLPSAQRTGEWIAEEEYGDLCVCDQCGEPCATYVMDKPRDRYCKWCGADMRNNGDD